jgi:lipopolysaccharide biosynthesis protein
MKQNLCVFAHYDRENRVDAYVLTYLQALRRVGYDIVFASASPLPRAELSKLSGIVFDAIVRENAGHDFGSWQQAMARHQPTPDGNLLMTNDSVYGPIGDLGDAIGRLTSQAADAYGMVENAGIARHLQSWFILLRPRAHAHPAFRRVFAQDFSKLAKPQIIRRGEVALSQGLIAAGLRLHALYTPTEPRGLLPPVIVNPTHAHWRRLVEAHGVPFLKVSLLRRNPGRISGLCEWRAIVEAHAPELVPIIAAHLARKPPGDDTRGGLHACRLRPFGPEGFACREERFASAPRKLMLEGNRALWGSRSLLSRIKEMLGPG